MFTGIVDEVGTVTGLDRTGGDGAATQDARLSVLAPGVTATARLGDSIAVNGVCLTVAATSGDVFIADVMPETLRLTSLGTLAIGAQVNLEPAVTPQSRLGGHLVQGHVDGVGTIQHRDPGPRWDVVRIALPPALARYVAPKGSIAVDGVSLTVVDVHADAFTVSLIPTTLGSTTLGDRAVGDSVNLEVDVVAKYVERLLGARPDYREDADGATPAPAPVTDQEHAV